MAVAEASFSTVKVSMSSGLIEPMMFDEPSIVELSTGTPSMTIRGSLLADSDAPLRTRMVAPEPGAPEPVTTLTPATLPTSASCMVTRLPLLNSSGSMAITEPVASDFFTLP